MESGCSSQPQSKSKKSDKSRRVWSDREESVLVDLLKELVSTGWKGDNGFRVGYLKKLEEGMLKIFPAMDLRGMPHINSKITVWKKLYGLLVSMLSRTGVGFIDSTKMIECTDEVWDLVVAEDPNAVNMRYKTWKRFDDWREIFGKDRATGENAEDVMEAVNELINEDHIANDVNMQSTHRIFQEHTEDNEFNSASMHDHYTRGTQSSGRKRKAKEGIEPLIEMVGELCRNTTERFDTIARRIGYEYDLAKKRNQIYNEVGKIPGLTLDEKLDASHMLAKNVECLEMFVGLPDEARSHYVRRLLSGHI